MAFTFYFTFVDTYEIHVTEWSWFTCCIETFNSPINGQWIGSSVNIFPHSNWKRHRYHLSNTDNNNEIYLHLYAIIVRVDTRFRINFKPFTIYTQATVQVFDRSAIFAAEAMTLFHCIETLHGIWIQFQITKKWSKYFIEWKSTHTFTGHIISVWFLNWFLFFKIKSSKIWNKTGLFHCQVHRYVICEPSVQSMPWNTARGRSQRFSSTLQNSIA